jgi:hypothetical protein
MQKVDPITKLFEFENWSTPGINSGVFRYVNPFQRNQHLINGIKDTSIKIQFKKIKLP